MMQTSAGSGIFDFGSYYGDKPMVALGSTLQILWW